MVRRILHIDMDAFFASVEQRDRPWLRGKPVVVGGEPSGRGVVAAASYEARRFGVRSAMPSRTAARLCPDLIFLRPDFARYKAVSQQLRGIFHDYTEWVEPLSLDEAFLDLTEQRGGLPTATAVAQQIRQRVREELRLSCSAGVGPCKLVAKIASDHRKPDGLTVIPPPRVQAFLDPLPIRRLWGVGPATAKRLNALGMETIGQIARAHPMDLAPLGNRAEALIRMAQGDDPRPVRPTRAPKSRGTERTFAQDQTDLQRLRETLSAQAEEVCEGLARHKLRARTITIKVRYSDFRTITRSRTLDQPTDDPAQVQTVAHQLLSRTDADRTPVRLIGLSLSGFNLPSASSVLQLELPLRLPATCSPR